MHKGYMSKSMTKDENLTHREICSIIDDFLAQMMRDISSRCEGLSYLGRVMPEVGGYIRYRAAFGVEGYDDYCIYMEFTNLMAASVFNAANSVITMRSGIAKMDDKETYNVKLTEETTGRITVERTNLGEGLLHYSIGANFAIIADNGVIKAFRPMSSSIATPYAFAFVKDTEGYNLIVHCKDSSDVPAYSEKDVYSNLQAYNMRSSFNYNQVDKCVVCDCVVRNASNYIYSTTSELKIILGTGIVDSLYQKVSVDGVQYRQLRSNYFIKDDE